MITTKGREELERTAEKVESKRNTFCSLCSKKVSKGQIVWLARDDLEQQYIIHLKCEDEEGINNTFFRENIKRKTKTEQKVKPDKEVYISNKEKWCKGCSLIIDGEYVRNGKGRKSAPYHQSCWEKYKKMLGVTKRSLR